jgi:hypothetical protein
VRESQPDAKVSNDYKVNCIYMGGSIRGKLSIVTIIYQVNYSVTCHTVYTQDTRIILIGSQEQVNTVELEKDNDGNRKLYVTQISL